MQRYQFKTRLDQLSLSYLDSGGNAPILIALHAHIMEGRIFIHLADSLSPYLAARRPNTALKILQGGHIVHFDNPKDFTKAVKRFLQDIPRCLSS
jgi:pimeloyl-ACP methyl ester carboxylesterase